MENALDVLKERGFVEQVTDEEQLRQEFEQRVTAYIGFDPTAKSLHVGSLLPIMSLAHLQRCGNQPISLVGGGTGMVGDPSGKTEMRKILTHEQIEENSLGLKKQLSRYLDFSDDRALMLNNADWLTKLNYIEFLRDIGRHFSVNRMLAAESYRIRMETGLNFIEFNYMLLQAYDFWHLYHYHGCKLQMGGNDQWGNIVAGIDLIRRLDQGEAYALTFPLITTSSGQKMGKTHAGAVWLDPELTSPYEFYQFWINTDDADVERFLALFTFLPMEEVREYGKLEGADLRKAKERLAFEATSVTHGKEEAENARKASRDLFANGGAGADGMPTSALSSKELESGVPAFVLFCQVDLARSRGEARRLIDQGGAYINNDRVENYDQLVTLSHVKDGIILLRAGKKKYHRIEISG